MMGHSTKPTIFNLVMLLGLGGTVLAGGLLALHRPIDRTTQAPRATLEAPHAPAVPASAGHDAMELGETRAAEAASAPDVESLLVAVQRERAARERRDKQLLAARERGLTVSHVASTFESIGYTLPSVVAGERRVPRLFYASLPADLGELREVPTRKAVFFRTVLPIVLKVNEEILASRERLWRLRYLTRLGRELDAVDRLWLKGVAKRYKTSPDDLDALLSRVDIIPPALALAQAAEESGWGTSRFAQEGNALFGQWTFDSDDQGLVPEGREAGKDHRIKAFRSIQEAVRAYTDNLNTHRAYRRFRAQRAAMRRDGRPVDGWRLAGTLDKYSARGDAYVSSLRTIIDVNGLRALDDARLHDEAVADNQRI